MPLKNPKVGSRPWFIAQSRTCFAEQMKEIQKEIAVEAHNSAGSANTMLGARCRIIADRCKSEKFALGYLRDSVEPLRDTENEMGRECDAGIIVGSALGLAAAQRLLEQALNEISEEFDYLINDDGDG